MFLDCVGRVPVSLWGSGGWGCVRSTLLNRSQPSATVRNRPRDGHMAVPMVSSAEGVVFGGFICGVASFRVAGVALRDIQTCFVTCRKSFCVAGAIPLRRFQKMRCSFQGRRSTLDMSIPTCRVACFLRIAMAGLRQVATRCRFRGRRGILWDMLKEVPKKTHRKTSILKLQRVKISGSLARNARFVSTRVSGFPVTSPCLWGKLQNLSFSKVFVEQHFGDLCRHFAWQAHSPRYILPTAHSTLYTPHSTLYTLHSTLYTLPTAHSTLHTLHSTLLTPHTPHSTHSTHSTLYTFHSTLSTPHFTPYTLHTPHSPLHTLHSTLLTLHSTLHTLPFPLYTFHSTLHTLHFTHSTLPTPHFTLHTPYFTLHTPHSLLYTPHCRMVTGEICTRVFK